MNESNSPNEPDGLQRIVDAFVEMSVPEGPDNGVRQSLLAAIVREEELQAEQSTHPKRGVRTMRRITSLAAAMLAAIAVGWVIMQMSANPRKVFAAMVEQFQNIRTASYLLEMEIKGLPKTVVKVMQMEPAWARQEIKNEELDFVTISNFRESKMLNLLRKEKTAQLIELEGVPESQRQKDYMEQFREMKGDKAEYLGRELIGGVSALKFRYDGQSEHYTLWLDPQDNLPVRVVMTDVEDEDAVAVRITMTDFLWNPELDESLFTLDIPAGYELVETSVDFDGNTTDDLVTMLRFVGRLNDDQFPDELNLLSMVPLLQKALRKPGVPKEEQLAYAQEKLAYALDRPDIVGMTKDEQRQIGLELTKPFAGGAMFMERMKQTHHLHYQGKGVKLGEADKIVAWWYPKKEKAEPDADLDTAHVLYGDLRIETMPVDELPQGDE